MDFEYTRTSVNGTPYEIVRVAKDGGRFTWNYPLGANEYENEAIREATTNGLRGYIERFYFFGCGGQNHVFDGDAADPETLLLCTKCGAAKLIGMSYPDFLKDNPVLEH